MKKEAEVIRVEDLTRKGSFCNIVFRDIIRKIFKNFSNPMMVEEIKKEMINTIETFSENRIKEIEEIDKL